MKREAIKKIKYYLDSANDIKAEDVPNNYSYRLGLARGLMEFFSITEEDLK